MNRCRTVLLTGASRGIGAAIADRLLSDGHTVIGLGRTVTARANDDRFVPVPIDLAQLGMIESSLRDVLRTHPGIDTVIANAGAPCFGHLEQHSVTAIRHAVELNLLSPMIVVKALLPRLKLNAPADVVIMGSESALAGAKRGTLYCAAKFGLRGFAQSLRAECGSAGVRVTMIQPGMVRTSFFNDLDFAPGDAAENAIEPEDVAAAVVDLLALRSQTVVDEIVLSPLTKVVRRPGGRRPS